MSIEKQITTIAKAVHRVAGTMATCSTEKKDGALLKIAELLEKDSDRIKSENQKDLENGKNKGLSAAMLDRLTISDAVIASMADGLREVAALDDPVGAKSATWRCPNGLEVCRMRIPLGVVGIIYESRPNVTVDAAGLCLKAGNVVVLRGGSEAIHSNRALAETIARALSEAGLPEDCVQVVPVTDREAVTHLLAQEEYIDLIIPRGGEGLIRFVVANSSIPVLKHYKGVCHVYVDADADLSMAENICLNAKAQRPGVCNSMETMLVHRDVAETFLPAMAERFEAAGVTLKGCDRTRKIVPAAGIAEETDWYAEYLDLILAVRIIDSMDDAMAHIATYSSDHTEAIVTADYERVRRFLAAVDSSVVLVNASTRFNDGGQLGLGAEIGISTSKLHAFGPMGVDELTTTKFIVLGHGQIRT